MDQMAEFDTHGTDAATLEQRSYLGRLEPAVTLEDIPESTGFGVVGNA